MQTKKGASKYRETMINKYGSYDAWREHLKSIGAKGGANGVGHTFAHGKADPAESGRKGGTISRRRPNINKVKKEND